MNKIKIVQTLCVVYRHPEILLGMKKRGFGLGKWNGFGGKVRKGEGIEEAAKRELKEEIGLVSVEMEKVGIINFDFSEGKESPEVHFFWVKKWTGNPIEGEEMRPAWYDVKDIPLDKMWSSDKLWMPLFLNGKKFRGKVFFGKNTEIIDHKLEVVEKF